MSDDRLSKLALPMALGAFAVAQIGIPAGGRNVPVGQPVLSPGQTSPFATPGTPSAGVAAGAFASPRLDFVPSGFEQLDQLDAMGVYRLTVILRNGNSVPETATEFEATALDRENALFQPPIELDPAGPKLPLRLAAGELKP